MLGKLLQSDDDSAESRGRYPDFVNGVDMRNSHPRPQNTPRPDPPNTPQIDPVVGHAPPQDTLDRTDQVAGDQAAELQSVAHSATLLQRRAIDSGTTSSQRSGSPMHDGLASTTLDATTTASNGSDTVQQLHGLNSTPSTTNMDIVSVTLQAGPNAPRLPAQTKGAIRNLKRKQLYTATSSILDWIARDFCDEGLVNASLSASDDDGARVTPPKIKNKKFIPANAIISSPSADVEQFSPTTNPTTVDEPVDVESSPSTGSLPEVFIPSRDAGISSPSEDNIAVDVSTPPSDLATGANISSGPDVLATPAVKIPHESTRQPSDTTTPLDEPQTADVLLRDGLRMRLGISDAKALRRVQKAIHQPMEAIIDRSTRSLASPIAPLRIKEDAQNLLKLESEYKSLVGALRSPERAGVLFERWIRNDFGQVLLSHDADKLRRITRTFVNTRGWLAHRFLDPDRPAMIASLAELDRRIALSRTRHDVDSSQSVSSNPAEVVGSVEAVASTASVEAVASKMPIEFDDVPVDHSSSPALVSTVSPTDSSIAVEGTDLPSHTAVGSPTDVCVSAEALVVVELTSSAVSIAVERSHAVSPSINEVLVVDVESVISEDPITPSAPLATDALASTILSTRRGAPSTSSIRLEDGCDHSEMIIDAPDTVKVSSPTFESPGTILGSPCVKIGNGRLGRDSEFSARVIDDCTVISPVETTIVTQVVGSSLTGATGPDISAVEIAHEQSSPTSTPDLEIGQRHSPLEDTGSPDLSLGSAGPSALLVSFKNSNSPSHDSLSYPTLSDDGFNGVADFRADFASDLTGTALAVSITVHVDRTEQSPDVVPIPTVDENQPSIQALDVSSDAPVPSLPASSVVPAPSVASTSSLASDQSSDKQSAVVIATPRTYIAPPRTYVAQTFEFGKFPYAAVERAQKAALARALALSRENRTDSAVDPLTLDTRTDVEDAVVLATSIAEDQISTQVAPPGALPDVSVSSTSASSESTASSDTALPSRQSPNDDESVISIVKPQLGVPQTFEYKVYPYAAVARILRAAAIARGEDPDLPITSEALPSASSSATPYQASTVRITTVPRTKKTRSKVGSRSASSKALITGTTLSANAAAIKQANRKEKLKSVEDACRAMYAEMSPKDKEVEAMRLEYPEFVKLMEFLILVMSALSLTATLATKITHTTKWILATESNRKKFLWRLVEHSNALGRQWILDFVAALENGLPPPPPPDGLPDLFATVPESPDLRKLMHRPVIYAVVGKPSKEKGPNEQVGKAVERAMLEENLGLDVASLCLIYVGIARGAEGFISRNKGYVRDFRVVGSRQAQTLFGSPDAETYESDKLLPSKSDFKRVCLFVLPDPISAGEGALFEGLSALALGAICVDALWLNELRLELETGPGRAILEKVFGHGGDALVQRGKAAMLGKSHLQSGLLGMNRINPLAHGIRFDVEKSDGRGRIRGFIIRYLAPLASPEGLEIGILPSRPAVYLPQVIIATPSNASGSLSSHEHITIVTERPGLRLRPDINWKETEHVQLRYTPSTTSCTLPIDPLAPHPIMNSIRIYVEKTGISYAPQDLLTEAGEMSLERWILKVERTKISLADVRYQSSFALEQILPRLDHLVATTSLSEHAARVRRIIIALEAGRGIPVTRQLRIKSTATLDHPLGELFGVRLTKTATSFPVPYNININHPSLHGLFKDSEAIYLDKRGARFWLHDGGSNQFRVGRKDGNGNDRAHVLKDIWSGIMTAYEEYLNELDDEEEEDD